MKTPAVKLDVPIRSVTVLDEMSVGKLTSRVCDLRAEQQSRQIHSLCDALEKAAAATEQSCQNLFISQKEKIVQLSIEIAAKILARDIREGNYDIKAILSEALQTIPVSSQMIVRLNPQDLEMLRNMVKEGHFELPENVQFIDDSGVGPSECIVESDQGVVEYLIEKHLKQIEAVLTESVHQTDPS